MLNHTYTSVNNANLVDCGKKQHISSQPSPLLKDNFLGEFRTELDKKKVLANLGIASDLVLEWKNIKGDIGQNEALMEALDARTKYSSELNPDIVTIADGIAYIESILGKDLDAESTQNTRLAALEETTTNLRTDLEAYKDTLSKDLTELNNYITNTVDVEFAALSERIKTIVSDLENINNLITVSDSDTNALKLKVDEHAGLYVENLSPRIDKLDETVGKLGTEVSDINKSLDTFVTIEQLGGDGEFDFVNQSDFSSFSTTVDQRLGNFEKELERTVKTGEDGHVDTLFVNKISKDNDGNIEVTDSFDVTTNQPLDVRLVRKTIDDLLSLPVSVCYEGMGVIVSSLNSLYILKHTDGNLTQAYVSDINNWKCPEDLVTVAMTQEDYDNLLEKNPNVFYYIYEEEITHTKAPNRDAYDSDEEYQKAWTEWEESLKILSQEYMSAAWGVDIETKLGQKASVDSVNLLGTNLQQVQKDIASIKGNGTGPSLESLGESIVNLQETSSMLDTKLKTLVDTLEDGTESGRIVNLETNLLAVQANLNDYVTKEDLQDETQEFIFVKTTTYAEDKAAFIEQQAQSFETKQLKTESINTESLTLNNFEIQIEGDHVTISDEPLAWTKDLMKVEVLTQNEYNQREENQELEDNTYYYTYEDNVSLVTREELQTVKNDILELQTQVIKLQQSLDELKALVQGPAQSV